MIDFFLSETADGVNQADNPSDPLSSGVLSSDNTWQNDSNFNIPYIFHFHHLILIFQFISYAMLRLQPVRFGAEHRQLATERPQSFDFITAQRSFFPISASSTRQKCSTSWLKVLFFFMMIIINLNIKIVPTTLCRVVGTCYQSCYSLRRYPPL